MVSAPRPLILLVLFVATLTAGEREYYISYRLSGSRATLVDEHLHISRAMVPFQGDFHPICTFSTDTETFENFAKKSEQPLLECLIRQGVLVHAFERIVGMTAQRERVEMIVPPTPLKVVFNDGLVIIKAAH